MGIEDPGLWIAAGSVSTGVTAVGICVFKVIRGKIRADRDRDLAAMALRDSKPEERPAILERLAHLRPFNALAPRENDDDQPTSSLPIKLPQKRRQ